MGMVHLFCYPFLIRETIVDKITISFSIDFIDLLIYDKKNIE